MRTHGGSALLFGSGLYLVLFGARVVTTGGFTYGFMLWNLALALTPWVLAQASCAAASCRWSALAWTFGIAWFVFLPNAPYLVTDFVHLRPRVGAPLWYDATLLGTAALIGLASGGLSLRTIHGWVSARHGRLVGTALLGTSALATGLGIYLGRFERWNSWDLVLRPGAVLENVFALVRDPEPRAVVVTGIFAGLTALAYLVVGPRPAVKAGPR